MLFQPKKIHCLILAGAAILALSCQNEPKEKVLPSPIQLEQDYAVQPVLFTAVKVEDDFWSKRLKTAKDVTIPFTMGKLDETGRIKNFQIAAGKASGEFCTNFTFDDTDLYKILEGVSYVLMVEDDHKLEAKADSLINLIGEAQEPDGYIFTNRTIMGENAHEWAGKSRWEKVNDLSHELYNIGHLIEAGVAHYYATGKRNLLDIAVKAADRVCEDFAPGKIEDYPGHQIVELALAKLYRATGEINYLETSKFLLDMRNNGSEYSQSHIPVTEQKEAVGHAVRGVYMYAGMADIAAMKQEEAYLDAINSIWEDVVSKKIYITGGIGSTGHGEAFGGPYELPNMSAYCETCAAIGNVYWNHRLFLLSGESKYYDVLERTLYNGLLSGVSMTGNQFFYPNPLESHGQHERSPWFSCACCPSNVARFVPSIPGYFYAQKDDVTYVNMYAEGSASIRLADQEIHLKQTTDYPWNGNIKIAINPAKEAKFSVKLRIPGWARNEVLPSDLYTYNVKSDLKPSIDINGQDIDYQLEKGYAVLERTWKEGDIITLDLPMPVRTVRAHEKVVDDRDKLAIQRGPLVYAAEWPDQPGEKVLNLVLDSKNEARVISRPELLGGVRTIEISGKSIRRDEQNQLKETSQNITLIPYYAWAHRGTGEMAVWLPTNSDGAQPQLPPTIASKSKVSGSHPTKAIIAVNDQKEPSNSQDQSIIYYHWWPKKNSTEWLQYDFEKEAKVSSAEVYWFDDGPFGGTRIPKSWKIMYKDGGEWKPVSGASSYGVAKDQFNKVQFVPVTTSALRLEVTLPKEFASGVMEWKVK